MAEAPGILLVEDNDDDVNLTLVHLRRHRALKNTAVMVARDGESALAGLSGGGSKAGRPLPRLVLLDLHLPGIDGMEFLRRIRADERTKRIPVVILTSSKVDEDLVRSWDLGADAYLTKPIEMSKLARILRDVGRPGRARR